MATALEVVQSVMLSHTGIGPDGYTMASNLWDDLELDSLDLVQMLLMAEEELGIELDEHELDWVRTVGDLVKVVSDGMKV
jgi:acyl carrier protein